VFTVIQLTEPQVLIVLSQDDVEVGKVCMNKGAFRFQINQINECRIDIS
jgi:hypothetical protein